jgi:hypothetical protein
MLKIEASSQRKIHAQAWHTTEKPASARPVKMFRRAGLVGGSNTVIARVAKPKAIH